MAFSRLFQRVNSEKLSKYLLTSTNFLLQTGIQVAFSNQQHKANAAAQQKHNPQDERPHATQKLKQ
jgi:hypothetical protein